MKCKLKENFDELLWQPESLWVKKVKEIQQKHGFIKINKNITADSDYKIIGYDIYLSPRWIDILEVD